MKTNLVVIGVSLFGLIGSNAYTYKVMNDKVIEMDSIMENNIRIIDVNDSIIVEKDAVIADIYNKFNVCSIYYIDAIKFIRNDDIYNASLSLDKVKLKSDEIELIVKNR